MTIKEVLKLKDGTQVKMVGYDDNIWIVINGVSLILKGKGMNIEDRYTLSFILDAEFEKYYEPLTISEVLCKDRVGHIIKMVGDDSTVYKVSECGGRFDLDIKDSPMRISDEHFLSTVLNSMYIDFDACGEDFLYEEYEEYEE